MPRTPDARIEQARALYDSGKKLKEIASALEVSEGTVRSWKNRYKWGSDSNATLYKNVAKEKSVANAKKHNSEAVETESNEVVKNTDLTSKQQLFCCLYIKCFNATKAYQKAYGVDYQTASAAGARMLRNVKVKKYIQELKQNRLNREMLSEEDIFQKYMDIAFADITDYVEFGREQVPVMGPFGPIMVKDDKTGEKREVKKEVNVVRFREHGDVDGTIISEIKQGKDGASIKLADRMKALQWISDHMDLATEEQRARIAVMQSKIVPKDENEKSVQDWKDAIIAIAKRRSEQADGRND